MGTLFWRRSVLINGRLWRRTIKNLLYIFEEFPRCSIPYVISHRIPPTTNVQQQQQQQQTQTTLATFSCATTNSSIQSVFLSLFYTEQALLHKICYFVRLLVRLCTLHMFVYLPFTLFNNVMQCDHFAFPVFMEQLNIIYETFRLISIFICAKNILPSIREILRFLGFYLNLLNLHLNWISWRRLYGVGRL